MSILYTQKTKQSQYEINLTKRSLGKYGQVDVALLLNDNKLRIMITGKPDIFIKKPTPGLMACLLLPYEDLKESDINLKQEDLTNYVDIMKKVGFTGTKSFKYSKIIKPRLDGIGSYRSTSKISSSEDDDVFEDTRDKLNNLKIGTGLVLKTHQTNQELKNELIKRMGSIEAGNDSMELRTEVMILINKLLQTGDLPNTYARAITKKYNFN